MIRIPEQALKDLKSLNQAINELRQKHIKPTPKILSEMTGLSERQVSERAQIGKIKLIFSLDERLGDEGSSMIELIADKENDNDIEPELELSQLEKQLAGCMDCLNNKQALVVQRKMESVEHQVIGHGGVELRGRQGATKLLLFQCLCGLPALSAWRGSALPHLGGAQSQAAAIAAGPTSHQDLQALGTHLAKHCRLGT